MPYLFRLCARLHVRIAQCAPLSSLCSLSLSSSSTTPFHSHALTLHTLACLSFLLLFLLASPFLLVLKNTLTPTPTGRSPPCCVPPCSVLLYAVTLHTSTSPLCTLPRSHARPAGLSPPCCQRYAGGWHSMTPWPHTALQPPLCCHPPRGERTLRNGCYSRCACPLLGSTLSSVHSSSTL